VAVEQSRQLCGDDVCVEVKAESVRIRKVVLDEKERGRAASRAKR
jgi:GTP-binding protein